MSSDQRYYSRCLSSMMASASSLLQTRPPLHASAAAAATGSPAEILMPAQASNPPTPRRPQPLDIWGLFGKTAVRNDDDAGEANMAEGEEEDDAMQVDEDGAVASAVSDSVPPPLPPCSLAIDFQSSDTRDPVPPAFYPGQAIPTVLKFQLDRHATLPHAYNPSLTMSLLGTLETPHTAPRTIICVSVSLAEGLAIWARDAALYASKSPSPPLQPHEQSDTARDLRGGTYSLPLTVQVPSTPRLPPSFVVPGAQFRVTYALNVTLTCDDPVQPARRVVLAESSKGFEMMPETLPTRMPRYQPQSFFVRSEVSHDSIASLARRSNSRWTVQPSIPTTAYSPTSQVPLTLSLLPPPEPTETSYQVLVRLALVRREHATSNPQDLRDPHGHAGLIQEEEINTRYTWYQTRPGEGIDIKDAIMPIMLDGSWMHGYSTVLNVGPPTPADGQQRPKVGDGETIAVSSTFHLATTLAFLPMKRQANDMYAAHSSPSLHAYVRHLPEQGQWTPAVPAGSAESLDLPAFKRVFPGSVRMLPLPIVIGSVSEPRGALRSFPWSDLHLDQSSGREVGCMVHGESVSCEDGWLVAPPAYPDALLTVPYSYT